MEDGFIYYRLNEHLKELQKHYPIENILGIFMLSETEDKKDILTEAVVIPLFEEVCTIPEAKIIYIGTIKTVDIRIAYNATNLGHPEIINALYTDYLIVNPLYEHTFQNLFISNRDRIRENAGTAIPAAELKMALIKICRNCWNESSKVVKFIKQLDDIDKIALEGIVKTIGSEGVISQTKLASSLGISRFAIGNLIMKMKFHDVAIVEYRGKLGTYIKIIDDTLLNIKAEKMK